MVSATDILQSVIAERGYLVVSSNYHIKKGFIFEDSTMSGQKIDQRFYVVKETDVKDWEEQMELMVKLGSPPEHCMGPMPSGFLYFYRVNSD